MEYHLDTSLRRMLGKATWNGSLSSYIAALNLLDEHHADMFHRSFLWPLYELRDLQFSGQIIDALLCQLSSPLNDYAFHYDIGGKVVSFSIFDFALIIELQIMGDDAARVSTQRGSKLHDTYFQGQGTVLLLLMMETIRRCDHMLDRLKLGLVYILESMLRCSIWRLWGRRCFEDTVHIS